MTARALIIFLPAVSAGTHRASAQDSALVDPRVSAVATGGQWTAEARSGYYRVIIRTGGVEHASSDLTLQWLAAPDPDALPTVVRSVAIKELSGIGRLDRPQLGQFQKGWRLWVHVTDTQSPQGAQTIRAVDLGPPGEVKVRPPS
ncbi:MAG TPA: hypothetical protein VGQ17_08000 [Gemmatimonadales bacterium]|jgi:hypothetical protein|nr:hypothetical protein [Gemmatimonadales bacterium]